MKVEENQSEWPSCLIYSAAAPFDASHCKRCCLIPFRCELKCFEERHAFSGKQHKKKYSGEPGDIAKRRREEQVPPLVRKHNKSVGRANCR